MRTPFRQFLTLALVATVLACFPARAATFTTNSAIPSGDTTYDGSDIIVTNCVLTVDGNHAFASIHIATGGVLTDSAAPGGSVSNFLFVTNQAYGLFETNPVTLLESNIVLSSITIADATGTNFYTNGVDYLLSSVSESNSANILTELQRTTNSSIPDGGTVLANYELPNGTAGGGLNLVVAGTVQVDVGGAINADGKGYADGGIGIGHSAGSPIDGSGGGYGGIGGTSSSNALGGSTYGSFYTPSNLGSSGGYGNNEPGGAGGGLIEIAAKGSVIVDGLISANGGNGTNSRSGGGSGGSVSITCTNLSGTGTVTANGGSGDLPHGGGGGGGRIAFQYPSGESNSLLTLEIISNSPSGTATSGVSNVVVYFNEPPQFNSVNGGDFSLTTPNGFVPATSVSELNSTSYSVNYPLQTAVGPYTFVAGASITDQYGFSMAQGYTNTFSISLPFIQGTITDTNGKGMAGVTLQSSVGSAYATTDTNGNYAFGFIPGSTFTLTPSSGALVFTPPSMSYSNLSTTLTNQNYAATSSLAPVLAAGVNGANLVLSFQGLAGVTYQVYSSPDLVNWTPDGSAFTASNQPVQVIVPETNGPQQYFSIQAGY